MSSKQALMLLFSVCLLASLLCAQTPAEGAKKESHQIAQEKGLPFSTKSGGTAVGGVAGIKPTPGQIKARSALLLEVSTGTTICEQNADKPIEPASFTKILTLYLINQALKTGDAHLNDEVYISEQAWRTGGSRMFLKVGTSVPLAEIIKGIAVVSGNDACVAAGEHFAGNLDAFVELMNQKSQELGMSESRFLNPHGLPAKGHMTTARDMATMNLAYLRMFPESLRFHSMQEYTYNGITQPNRNRLLLRDPSVDGLKTGYVSASGYHLAATAERDGMRLLAVVMGAPSAAVREREALKLLNFGFRFYTLVKPFSQEERISTISVWKGTKDQLDIYPSETPQILVAQADKNSLRWEVHTVAEVTAPVAPGTQLGEVTFYVSDRSQKTVSLVNREEVVQAGWFKRGRQTALRIALAHWKISAMGAGGLLVLSVLVIAIAHRKATRRSKMPFIR